MHVAWPPPHELPLATHLPRMQQPPLSQELSAQHGWPSPPHCWQVPPLVPLPFAHAVVEALHQFGWPAPPLQHGCPSPPQVPHPPAAHTLVAAVPHAVPVSTHVLACVQQPLVQVLSAQHGWVEPPHAVHAPFEQTSVGEPHGSPEAMHEPPAPPEQQPPPAHGVAPAQQGCPGSPHGSHVPPALHTNPLLHVEPQHG